MKYNILFVLFLFCLSSCNKLPGELRNKVSKEVQEALDEAGANRGEMGSENSNLKKRKLIIDFTETEIKFRGRKKGAAHLSVFTDRTDCSSPLYLNKPI